MDTFKDFLTVQERQELRGFLNHRDYSGREHGLEAALERGKREPRVPRFDGAQQARIIATTCSRPPDGRARWTLRLLAEKVVELEIVESISKDGIGAVLTGIIHQHLKNRKRNPSKRLQTRVLPPLRARPRIKFTSWCTRHTSYN